MGGARHREFADFREHRRLNFYSFNLAPPEPIVCDYIPRAMNDAMLLAYLLLGLS
jgi:hypothetical protein